MSNTHHSRIVLTINNKYFEFDVEFYYEPEQRGNFEQEHIPESFDILNLTNVNSPDVGSYNSLIPRLKSDIIEQIKGGFLEWTGVYE